MTLRRALFAALLLALAPALAAADRRYFVQSYTPYLSPAGETEVEFHAIARNGQGDSTNTSWGNRAEFEYGLTDRLTGALYLNFVQPGGDATAMKFDGPSIELIGRLADRGKIPLDPALYLEVRESGTELEIEPKLLFAHRRGGLVCVANLIGEFETPHRDGATSRALRITGGVSHEFGPVVGVGIEALYHRQFESSASNPSTILLGPTINLQKEKIQLSLGWHPQVWGDPSSAGSLNLRDFPRSEVRLLLGLEL